MDRSQVKAREVASRVPLDYYKKPDPLFRRKVVLAIAAAIASGVWVFSMFIPGKVPVVGPERFSHGSICRAHASFGHECSACHTSFPLFGGPREADGSFKGDSKCMECHLGNGGAAHSAIQSVQMTPNCGVCHTDHKGANFAMKRVIDKQCIGCHADLDKSLEEGVVCRYTDDEFKTIKAFPGSHPTKSLSLAKGDPGQVKFNHKYHTTDGIVLAQGGKPFRVRDMGEGAMKSKILSRGVGLDAPVTLTCADCHQEEKITPTAAAPSDPFADKIGVFKLFEKRQADRGRLPTGELRPPHVDEAYMAPINYDSHCAACHPLKFDAKLPAVTHKQLDPQTRKLAPQDKQLSLLRAEVERLLAGASPAMPTPPLLGLPGKPPGFSAGGGADAVMRSLLEGKRVCGECHVDASGSDLTASSKTIAESKIPNEWFQHARFNHKPHIFMNCRDCHKEAYAYNTNKVWDEKGVLGAYAKPRKGAEDVMIPGLDNCKQCHSPNPTLPSPQKARHDCTECHGYHHGKGAAGAQK